MLAMIGRSVIMRIPRSHNNPLQKFHQLHCQKIQGLLKFPWSASSQLYFSGGGSPEKKSIHTITAKGFSYPHTEFEALRSRGLAVNRAKN